ncbi:MAG TPA: FAD-dependent thymidylate synthase [Anaerolineaceae bacterium]|nr:FAD-dependent thymidylate synthase [Anaerolineaceae bacterium]HPN54078.1 FAD-dependent thymidylate synthase [Anaerolineaceae bacterium]
MSDFDRQVYLLDPHSLGPETIAVTFAKTSRSPQSFREIAAELTEEKSAQFHEKWVVGYGHASVAEHAVLHVAMENISRLAVETLESNRLASYTEKSTRYQTWSRQAFFTPPELDREPRLKEEYQRTCQMLFSEYEGSLDPVRKVVAERCPCREGESQTAWDRRIRSEYVDVCRFYLPASSLANVGMTANARVVEHAIRKMLSSPLQEVRELGEAVKQVCRQEAPTLVKYADHNDYIDLTGQDLTQEAQNLKGGEGDWCCLAAWDEEGEARALAAALYRFGGMPFNKALAHVKGLDSARYAALVDKTLGRLGSHDFPLRELEYAPYIFDVVMDQGAYFEIKRHRMMTQTAQPLTADLGYAVPLRMRAAGIEAGYRNAMEQAAVCYRRLAEFNPAVASYVVPNGYNRRMLLGMNLREAFHFCRIRSAENAHFSARRVALRIAEEIRRCHPAIGARLPVQGEETWQDIEVRNFIQTR